MPVPQYSQVMTISPNFGEIGAPQCGHLSAVAPIGAITGVAVGFAGLDCAVATSIPHFRQKWASSGSWAPHLGQYNVTFPLCMGLSVVSGQVDHSEASLVSSVHLQA